MMKKFLFITGLVFAIFFVISCESSKTYFSTKINSFGKIPPKKSYFIAHTNSNIKPDDIEFQWFASYVNYALYKENYVLANDYNSADLIILIDYSISDPKYYTVQTPILGQVGTGEYETTGNVQVRGNRATYTEKTKEKTTIGVTGYNTEQLAEYLRTFNIYCYDLKEWRENKKEKMYWKTNVQSTGNSYDLRYVFPYLVYGASFYFEQSSGNIKNISIEASGEKVKNFYNWK